MLPLLRALPLLAAAIAMAACTAGGDALPSPAASPTPSPLASPTATPGASTTPPGTPIPVPTTPAAASGGRYEVTIRFNASVSQDDLDEVNALLAGFDRDVQFLVMEIFPPIGRATLATDAPDFCEAVAGEIQTKTYVQGVDCRPITAPPAPVTTETPVVTSGPSGIEGTVLLGPMCPVVQVESPCPDQPVQATVVVWDAGRSRRITAFTADEDGRFRIELAPGDYYLDPQPLQSDRPLPAGGPQTVTVLPGAFTAVTIQYDTGIR